NSAVCASGQLMLGACEARYDFGDVDLGGRKSAHEAEDDTGNDVVHVPDEVGVSVGKHLHRCGNDRVEAAADQLLATGSAARAVVGLQHGGVTFPWLEDGAQHTHQPGI